MNTAKQSITLLWRTGRFFAAILIICNLSVLSSCSSDDENQLNKWPTGQWIYEGQWLDYNNIDAVVLSFSMTNEEKEFEMLARSAVDGLWYSYPMPYTYSIDLATGTITYGGKKFCTYKLTDDKLTLTVGNDKYVFTRTHGIKNQGGMKLPELTSN